MPEEYTSPIPAEFNPISSSSSAIDDMFKSDMAKLADTMLEDREAEKRLSSFPLWTANVKSLKVTFLTQQDVIMFENLYEAENCRVMRRLPPSQQNFDTYNIISQARILFKANIRRSLGTSAGIINERLAFLTTVKQFTPLENISGAPHSKKSIGDRILGR